MAGRRRHMVCAPLRGCRSSLPRLVVHRCCCCQPGSLAARSIHVAVLRSGLASCSPGLYTVSNCRTIHELTDSLIKHRYPHSTFLNSCLAGVSGATGVARLRCACRVSDFAVRRARCGDALPHAGLRSVIRIVNMHATVCRIPAVSFEINPGGGLCWPDCLARLRADREDERSVTPA
jgi:hypothetical protein